MRERVALYGEDFDAGSLMDIRMPTLRAGASGFLRSTS
jgi:hypothetical protein